MGYSVGLEVRSAAVIYLGIYRYRPVYERSREDLLGMQIQGEKLSFCLKDET